MPFPVARAADEVSVDPYGAESPEFVVDDHFAHMWCSALAHCQKRFEGQIKHYKNEPSGGIGCFTPDSFPVFDRFCENVYFVADSNHGYKMIGVGALVAGELQGDENALLAPFRFEIGDTEFEVFSGGFLNGFDGQSLGGFSKDIFKCTDR